LNEKHYRTIQPVPFEKEGFMENIRDNKGDIVVLGFQDPRSKLIGVLRAQIWLSPTSRIGWEWISQRYAFETRAYQRMSGEWRMI
jgi:hypothetical protein